MNVKKSKQGFTLAELIMGLLALSILMLIVGSLLILTWTGWADYSSMLGMQRDAHVAMREIKKEIRNSNISEISGDADSIDFISFGTRTTDFTYNSSEIPVSPRVALSSWSSPVIGSNYVTVAFVLTNTRGSLQKSYQMTISPRNEP